MQNAINHNGCSGFCFVISGDLTWHFYRYGNGMNATYANWIYLQCVKWGRVTFGKESLKGMLAATATDRNLLKQLKNYCSQA
jgi:hypothetical protein